MNIALKRDVERALMLEYEQVEDVRERIEAEREKFRKAQLEMNRERARRDGTLAEFDLMLKFEATKRQAAVDAAVNGANSGGSALIAQSSLPSASGARAFACRGVVCVHNGSCSHSRRLAKGAQRTRRSVSAAKKMIIVFVY